MTPTCYKCKLAGTPKCKTKGFPEQCSRYVEIAPDVRKHVEAGAGSESTAFHDKMREGCVVKTAPAQQPEEMVATMRLRWVRRRMESRNRPCLVLQQWHFNRLVMDANGGYPNGRWIDVPVEDE